jgi:hypothetical protein
MVTVVAPVLDESPAGREPAPNVNVYGAVPLDAVQVFE